MYIIYYFLARRDEINLLNQLPRRNIFIDKKLQYIKTNNTNINTNNVNTGNIKICYFIFTQIGNSRF